MRAPPPVGERRQTVDRVFAMALATRRDERYATCTDFADALCAALASRARLRIRLVVTRRRRSSVFAT